MTTFANLASYIQNNGYHLALFFLFLFAYGAVKLVWSAPGVFLDGASPRPLLQVMGSIAFIVAVSLAFLGVVGWGLGHINVAGIDLQVSNNNARLMAFDRAVFGVYVPFWFENADNPLQSLFRASSSVLVGAYVSLTMLLACALILALLASGALFTRVLVVHFAIIGVSMAIWYWFPVTSPFDAYIDHAPTPRADDSIAVVLATYHPSEPVVRMTAGLRQIRNDMGGVLWTTTMPSMHVAFAVVVMYVMWEVSRVMASVAVPYFVANLLATMTTLQHYAMDVIGGLIVGVGVVAVVHGSALPRIGPIDFLSETLREDGRALLRALRPPPRARR